MTGFHVTCKACGVERDIAAGSIVICHCGAYTEVALSDLPVRQRLRLDAELEAAKLVAQKSSGASVVVKAHLSQWALVVRTHDLGGVSYRIMRFLDRREALYLVKKRGVNDLLCGFDEGDS